MSELEPAILTVSGDLTEATAPALLESIREACAAGGRQVVLHVENATVVDPYGLGAIIRGLKIARDAGGDLVIGRASPELARMLSLTALDQVVSVLS